MNRDSESLIADASEAAEEISDAQAAAVGNDKPRLLVDQFSPDQTVSRLRDILAEEGDLFDRGVPVRLAYDQINKGSIAQAIP